MLGFSLLAHKLQLLSLALGFFVQLLLAQAPTPLRHVLVAGVNPLRHRESREYACAR
jgi:hypothetical protein